MTAQLCLGREVGSPATLYIFLFTFMVVWFNSLLVDIFCYVRISRSNPSFAPLE
jgi:hypothetical protein